MPTRDQLEHGTGDARVRLGGCVIHDDSWGSMCLSCGYRAHAHARTGWTERATPTLGAAVTAYSEHVRAQLDCATESIVSYLGLWLLLAVAAPADRTGEIADVLGIAPDTAAETARRLLDAPHPAVAAALGAWARDPARSRAGLSVSPLPDQETLDDWTREHTRGLIRGFPTAVTPDVLAVIASAVIAKPRWVDELAVDADGMLELTDGLQAIVNTTAAGTVAVAKPFSADGVDVLSVIAGPDITPDHVWRAVDEVVAGLDSGRLWPGDQRAPGSGTAGWGTDGHAWTVTSGYERVERDTPDTLWVSRLPRWRAESGRDLASAPGVAAAARALVPETDAPRCVQAAAARYDARGFEAAAVTSLACPTGVPEFHHRRVTRYAVTFDRPHAVIAVARGGVWEGVPLFNAWVTPEAPRSGARDAHW
ncbi:hypothetical protein [Tsukamurella soli]|uniref:Serpin (Serine protease inhibitor) n=2 Tax=Tsukamurella soli TaxID=644556 RepID=A0ABP8JE41_9ACTN